MKEAIGKGKTIDLAQEKACRDLGVDLSEATFEVIQIPERKKFVFFGGKEAQVLAKINDSLSRFVFDYIKFILKNISDKDIKIEMCEDNQGVLFNLSGEGVDDVIGKNGEILDSIQLLASLFACQKNNSYYRVMINVGDFRIKRKTFIEKMSKETINKFYKTRINVHLCPMNPYERRVAHEVVQECDKVSSWSEGEGIRRHVVIGEKIKKNLF